MEVKYCGGRFIDRLGTSYHCGSEHCFIGGKMQCPWCQIDGLEKQLAEKDKTIEKLRECMEHAYQYLKGTYDLHTWKDEPEYAMMKDFEQCLKEIEGDKNGSL